MIYYNLDIKPVDSERSDIHVADEYNEFHGFINYYPKIDGVINWTIVKKAWIDKEDAKLEHVAKLQKQIDHHDEQILKLQKQIYAIRAL